jgi:hypothetical protein
MTAYNLRRLISILGIQPLIAVFRAFLLLFLPQKRHISAFSGFIFNLKAQIKSFVFFSPYPKKSVLLLKI